MQVFDAHCDILWKIWESYQSGNPAFSFYEKNTRLQTNYPYMENADILLQTFAIYLPEKVKGSNRFTTALTMVDLYYEKIIRNHDKIVPILNKVDIINLKKSGKRGALLSLEGADALEGSLEYFRILYRLGLRSIGLTWNYRNEAADGCGEKKPTGLSRFGRELVSEANRLGVLLDVSHLSETGFWEVAQLSTQPIIASHSNCRAICNHPRNLTDDQIRMLIQKGGVIGLTFVPPFVTKQEKATIDDFLQHIYHLVSLGAEDNMAFGSDFDGIDEPIEGLENQEKYNLLKETLLKNFSQNQVEKWLWSNWNRVYLEILSAR